MFLGLRFQFKLSHTSEEEWVVVLFKILKIFSLLGPVHKIFRLQLIILLDNQVFICLLKLSLFLCLCGMVGIKDCRLGPSVNTCNFIIILLFLMMVMTAEHTKWFWWIQLNPGDGLGPSVNTHTCILQLLMVVGVEDGLGPGVNTHPCYFCFWWW